jgi:hypothetical protein
MRIRKPVQDGDKDEEEDKGKDHYISGTLLLLLIILILLLTLHLHRSPRHPQVMQPHIHRDYLDENKEAGAGPG